MALNIVEKKIDMLRDEIIENLRSLISIKSVAEDHEGSIYPFGEEVQKSMEFMFSLAAKENMPYKNIDNYGGHIDLSLEGGKEIMGILCHLDVVPEGTGWTKEPFGGEVVDGKLYGRGAIDDKGPTIAAFYAMKALKNAGVVLSKRVRLILGLDEETNWKGIKYYLNKEEAPDFGFTPDGDFPVIHGEKGILVFDLGKKIGKVIGKGIELRSIKGGNAANMVPDYCRVVIFAENNKAYEDIKEKAKIYIEKTGKEVKIKPVGKSIELTTKGVSAHGASPQLGENAISAMFGFLGNINFLSEDVNDFVKFYNEHIGFEINGKKVGCFFEDEPSGETIFNVGVVEGDGKILKITINVRYPVTITEQDIFSSMETIFNQYNIGLIKGKHEKPIYVPADSELILEFMDIYQKWTGRKEDKPMVIGGGTYARAVKNVYAFGPTFPGEGKNAHQKDEYIEVEQLIQLTKIYAEAIYRLAK